MDRLLYSISHYPAWVHPKVLNKYPGDILQDITDTFLNIRLQPGMVCQPQNTFQYPRSDSLDRLWTQNPFLNK